MKVRFVARLIATPLKTKVKHLVGLPPEVANDVDARQEMKPPLLLLIEQKPDGVFLFRLSANGQDAGDTWHRSIAEAKEQARFEYGDLVSDWKAVPDDVEDLFSL